jgi:hypothetical protein
MGGFTNNRASHTWSRKALAAAFLTIFWLVPFVAAVAGAAFSGDCSWDSESCTTTESLGLLVLVVVALFWIFVAAPVTLLLVLGGLVYAVASFAGRHRRVAVIPSVVGPAAAALGAPGSTQAGGRTGLPETYLWALAGFLWSLVFIGVVMVATADGETSYPGLAAAVLGAIMTTPLTVILVMSWLLRKLKRN